MLVNHAGDPKGVLARGEQKSLQTDRVILVPGPVDETQLVGWIYEQFTRQGQRESEIAAELNARGLLTDLGRGWTRGTVHQVLTNEKYVGNNVYNRTSFKLQKKHVKNPPEMWVRAEAAFTPIVSPELFFMARGIIQERARRISDEDMLARLRELSRQHVTVSGQLIDAQENLPTSASYRSRFGSLLEAYRRAGVELARDYGYLEINRAIRALYPGLLADLSNRLRAVGASVAYDGRTDLLLINGEYTATLVLSRCRLTPAGSLRWLVDIDQRLAPDITILARMDAANRQPVDYYLLPIMDVAAPRLLLCESNGASLDTYQFDSLEYFTALAARRAIEVAA
jgi:hypothetical protein